MAEVDLPVIIPKELKRWSV